MDNLKDIQNITGLTSEAIFNIRKPVDYMCSDIDSHIKDIETQCDYIMDRDEGDVIYYSKSITRIYDQKLRIFLIGENSGKYWLKICLMS
mgnify:CR=1 FL=1